MSEINNNEEFEINTNSKHVCDKCHQEIKEEKPEIKKESKEKMEIEENQQNENKKEQQKENKNEKQTVKSNKKSYHSNKLFNSFFDFKMPNMDSFSDTEEDENKEEEEEQIENLNNNSNDLMIHPFDDYFNNFFNFKSVNKQLKNNKNSEGTIFSKSYISQTKYDKNGKPLTQIYQNQKINQVDKDGHSIEEKHEVYKNTENGIEKAATERKLDGKGRKIIKERNLKTKEHKENNLFKGIDEKDVDEWENSYENYKKNSNFKKNYKYLNNFFGLNKKHNRQNYLSERNFWNGPLFGGFLC